MTMPGFTAEATLYQTDTRYRFLAGGSFPNSRALPQMRTLDPDDPMKDWSEGEPNLHPFPRGGGRGGEWGGGEWDGGGGGGGGGGGDCGCQTKFDNCKKDCEKKYDPDRNDPGEHLAPLPGYWPCMAKCEKKKSTCDENCSIPTFN